MIQATVARGFAAWKICHRRFATKKIRYTTSETYECDREFERKCRTNVCNSADVEDSPHSGDYLGSGGLGLGGLRSEGLGWGVGLRSGTPNSKPLTPNPQPLDLNPPNPNLSLLCGESSTSALLQTFVRRLRSNCRSHSLCGKSSVANLPCGEFSGNPSYSLALKYSSFLF